MFEFVRTHTKVLQLLLLLLILPSFVVFGIQGYSRFSEGASHNVATVDGQPITQAEWDAAHQRQVERVRQQMPNLDAKMFDTPAARAETLDSLIRERVLATAAQAQHLVVSDDRLQRMFVSDPQYAMLRNADGSVNKELLAAQGMNSEMFAARLRQDLAVQQVLRAVTDSELLPSSLASSAIGSLLQRREIRLARFDTKDYLARVNPAAADLEAYYKSHESLFKAPEVATVEYVVLDLDAIKQGITVPEEDLRKFYTENESRFAVAEERHARHILVKADKDAAPDVKQKAKAKAEALLAEVRQNPASFADVAKKNSDDVGTAAQGGDLDFFGRGAMTKPFEDAAYALKVGEISPVIESDFGYHIIKLEGIRGGQKKPFETVRAGIEDDVRRQLATKKWAEAAEDFTNTVYEQADSLQPVMDKMKPKLQKLTGKVQRTPDPGAKGPLASPKLLEAIFSNDVLKNKRNTAAVEVAANQLAAARVVDYQPARTLPLADVKDRVQEQVKAEQAAALARTEGTARLAQLRSATPGDLAQQATVSRNKPEGLDRKALEAVLGADASKLPVSLGVDLGAQGYLVVRIDKVLPPDVPAQEADALKAQLAQAIAQAESKAYYDALKDRFKAAPIAKGAAVAASAASQ
jgi:peptidyl-prolyl cis-trans isomerase D